MRIAVLTDLHANREATDGVLRTVRGLSPDRIVVLGDVVGYGPDPVWTVETVARLVEDGALCVMGNHDEAAVTGRGGMTASAEEAIRWTRTQLAPRHLDWLASLPMTQEFDGRLFVHASAARPDRWPYLHDADGADACLKATAADMVLCGHTHVPALFYALPGRRSVAFRPIDNVPAPLSALRRHVAVVGSTGQPRDGNPAACLGLLDTAAATLTMVRVPYDAAETARKIRAAGLPDRLASRLLTGS